MVLLNKFQIKSLLDSCNHVHQRTFIMLAIYTGMRHTEILSLKWSDVFLEKKLIKLRAKTTKAKRTRIVPLIPVLLMILAFHKKGLKQDRDHVVCYLGRKLTTFRKTWQLLMNELGWEYRIHDLRHHFITLLFSAGVNPRTIQEIAGHSTLNMTMKYAEYSDKYLEQEAKRVGVGRLELPTSTLSV